VDRVWQWLSANKNQYGFNSLLTEIIIVRHGSTEWNEQERFRGLADIGLSELGIRQAEATCVRLANLPVSKIYTSPLRRALQTANIIARPHKLEPIPLDGITDINFGKFQGLSFAEAEEKYKEIFSLWMRNPEKVTFPGGESLAEVRERSSSALDEIIAGLKDETVIFVSHKVVIGMLICHYLGLKDSQFRQVAQDTCAVNTFNRQSDNIYAVMLNDTCHLAGVK
jgi:broad specificity phosphatase PhoE